MDIKKYTDTCLHLTSFDRIFPGFCAAGSGDVVHQPKSQPEPRTPDPIQKYRDCSEHPLAHEGPDQFQRFFAIYLLGDRKQKGGCEINKDGENDQTVGLEARAESGVRWRLLCNLCV